MTKHYDFKQSVRVGRSTFPLGVRQVPPEIEAHPHFKMFLKDGLIKVAGTAQVEKKFEDLPTLPPPSTAAAQRSQAAAKAIEEGAGAEVAADTELGGDDDAGSDADEAPKKSRRGK